MFVNVDNVLQEQEQEPEQEQEYTFVLTDTSFETIYGHGIVKRVGKAGITASLPALELLSLIRFRFDLNISCRQSNNSLLHKRI